MIIAVDIGTSQTKAAAFDGLGTIHAEACEESRLLQYPDGRVEQDFDDVVATVAAVVKTVRARFDGPVDALALTGQGDGLWLRDAEARPVRPPVSWLDGRASGTVARWNADGTAEELHRRTGNGLFPGAQAPLLAHLAESEPESLREAAAAGYCVDSLVHVLTGEITVDASDASVPFLNPVTRSYDDRALDACGLTAYRRLLAKPAQPRQVFHLDERGSRLVGLPVGLPVTGGPYDLPACAIGAGLREPGDGLLIVGTTLACEVLAGSVVPDKNPEPAGMWMATPDEDRYLHAMAAMVGTASLDWVLDLVGARVADLGQLLAESPPGAGGVSGLPFLAPGGERAPFADPYAHGQLTGVRLGTRRSDVVRAVCESIAYAARHCFEAAALSGRLVACGGGTRSGPWSQVFADVLGRSLHISDDPGMGVRGAALTAAQAIGAHPDPVAWAPDTHEVAPDPEFRGCYESGYRRYRETLDVARSLWARQA